MKSSSLSRNLVFLLFVILIAYTVSADIVPIYKIPETELALQIQSDLLGVQTYRKGLQNVLQFMQSRQDLFPVEKLSKSRMLTREKKEEVWTAWKSFLDYVIALDSIGKNYRSFFLLKGETREQSFLISYSAFLAQYRFALEFIQIADRDPGFITELNEPVFEIGIRKGGYSDLKLRFLNLSRAMEFAAMQGTYKVISEKYFADVRKTMQEDAEYIWKAGKGRAEVLTAKNAADVLKQAGFTAYFPVQAKVSEWSGDTKVYRRNLSLISPKQIATTASQLQPGDILLERREWYVSNVGLPGFWPHAALYIGTPEERRKYFNDSSVTSWVKQKGKQDGDFESLLQDRYPQAYADSLIPHERHSPRVLEAISEGVSFTSLEHSADCDSLAVLRPRLSKRDKAIAIFRAFQYAGRPYDFNFDFLTDSSLVCTELIYKAYEPAQQFPGLVFPLREILGRKATPANEIVKQFDQQFGRLEQQTDLILFLDGYERRQTAIVASGSEFRNSWKRPKWHIVTQ